jgi:1-acyl-sn-glycerol-3-phosphate acyltransferase
VARRRYGFWYRLAAVIAKPPLIAIAKRDWRGLENIPAEGGFLTAVNHNSYLDTVVYPHFQYNTGRPARLLAKAALFRVPGLKWVMNGTGMIPVYRGTAAATDAFRGAVDAVHAGECVAFFPEGTLTRDPELWPMTGKTGIARVALATGAPVIPIAQWGGHLIMPPYAKGGKGHRRFNYPPRGTVHVLAGPPVDLTRFQDREVTPELLRQATDAIMDAITELLEELRGEKAPEGRWDMRRKTRVPRAGAGAGAVPGTAPTAPTAVPEQQADAPSEAEPKPDETVTGEPEEEAQ